MVLKRIFGFQNIFFKLKKIKSNFELNRFLNNYFYLTFIKFIK